LTKSTWTRLEFGVASPDQITPPATQPPAPPLTLMSLTLRTTMNHKENRQEIVLAAARVYENVSLDDPTPADKLPCYGFTLIRPIEGGVFPLGFESELKKIGWSGRVNVQRNEASLLNLLTGTHPRGETYNSQTTND
jgi:DNA polymerase alpha subunit A